MVTDNTTDLSERASSTQKNIGRSVSINGVHAVDITLDKSENLNSAVLDLNIKVNNPLGRLYLALQRFWQNQNTVIALRFTIPLLVLPIAIYVGWKLWQGRGVNTPLAKLGIIHQVTVANLPVDILVVPTSDVYMLSYQSDFDPTHRLTEKPTIVIGTYNNLTNTFYVDDIVAYNQADIIPDLTPVSRAPTVWDTIIRFIDQFR